MIGRALLCAKCALDLVHRLACEVRGHVGVDLHGETELAVAHQLHRHPRVHLMGGRQHPNPRRSPFLPAHSIVTWLGSGSRIHLQIHLQASEERTRRDQVRTGQFLILNYQAGHQIPRHSASGRSP